MVTPARGHREESRRPRGAGTRRVLLVGDLDGAVDALERVSPHYLAPFLRRLESLMPGVSFRMAWRVARGRLRRSER